jgi:hypothetical protein
MSPPREDEQTLELRIHDYLEGALDLDASREVERALATPAGSALLSQALALREALATTPGEPPEGLVTRLQAAVAAELGEADRARVEASATRVALDGLRWSLSWLAPATYGLGSVRLALGARTLEEPAPAPRKARPLWRRLLFRGRK